MLIDTAVSNSKLPVGTISPYLPDLPQQNTDGLSGPETAQAVGIQQANFARAEAIAQDDDFQYAMLQNNGYNGDGLEAALAMEQANLSRNFMTLFWDSLQELQRSGARESLLAGEQVRFLPRLKTRHGQPGGLIDEVILNPVRHPQSKKPVIEILLPHTPLAKEVNARIKRLKDDKNGAVLSPEGKRTDSLSPPSPPAHPAHTHPPDYTPKRLLVWYVTQPMQREIIENTVPFLDPALPLTRQRTMVEQMQKGLEMIKLKEPDDLMGVRTALCRLGESVLNLSPEKAQQWAEKTHANMDIHRATLIEDLSIVALQRVQPADIPSRYKGVTLTPAQQKDLMLGKGVELDGLKDDKREGLYRAIVGFDLLSGQINPRPQKEKAQTQTPEQQQLHQHATKQADSDKLQADRQTVQRSRPSLDMNPGHRLRPGSPV